MEKKDKVKINIEVPVALKESISLLASSFNADMSTFIRDCLQKVTVKYAERIESQRKMSEETFEI